MKRCRQIISTFWNLLSASRSLLGELNSSFKTKIFFFYFASPFILLIGRQLVYSLFSLLVLGKNPFLSSPSIFEVGNVLIQPEFTGFPSSLPTLHSSSMHSNLAWLVCIFHTPCNKKFIHSLVYSVAASPSAMCWGFS